MNSEELLNKQKDEAYDRASKIYNQLVNESKQITNNQTNQIDDFIDKNTNQINESVRNNISNLENASQRSKKRHENELISAQKDYDKYITAPISENARVTAQNALRNRQLITNESKEAVYQEYLNASNEAKLTGDSTIAQLALETLKTKLNLNSSMTKYNQTLALNKMDNDRSLSNDYWNRAQNIRSALNEINKLKENQRQFNETLSYQKEQDKIKNDLAEKEYQLDLSNAKNSYYRSSSSSGRSSYSNSGSADGDYLVDSSTKNNVSQTGGNGALGGGSNTRYYCNYTPLGLTKQGNKVFKSLSKIVDSKGYVTLNQIEEKIKKLPKDQQGIIASAFKNKKTGGGGR